MNKEQIVDTFLDRYELYQKLVQDFLNLKIEDSDTKLDVARKIAHYKESAIRDLIELGKRDE